MMESKKNSKQNLDYRKVSVAVIILIIAIVIIVICTKNVSKHNKLNFSDFERIAIYNYLENDLLNVSKLYQLSGKSNYNDLQIFQSKLKQALDLYFSRSNESEVSTSTIMGLVDSSSLTSGIDFHGIIVSDYEYVPENDTFIKSPGANANIAGIEAGINSIDYSNKKAIVQNIEKISNDTYKVTFNITNDFNNPDIIESSGEAILSIKDNEINIDSCTIND